MFPDVLLCLGYSFRSLRGLFSAAPYSGHHHPVTSIVVLQRNRIGGVTPTGVADGPLCLQSIPPSYQLVFIDLGLVPVEE